MTKLKAPTSKPVSAFAEIKHNPLDRENVMDRAVYLCPELRPFAGRPGAMDAFKLPSRIGDELLYLKGHNK